MGHDDAYAWARRQRASVNRATGVIELRDVVAVEDQLPTLLPGTTGATPLLRRHKPAAFDAPPLPRIVIISDRLAPYATSG